MYTVIGRANFFLSDYLCYLFYEDLQSYSLEISLECYGTFYWNEKFLYLEFFFFFFMLHYTWNLDKMLIFHPHVLLFESQHHFKTLLYWTQTIVIFRFYSWSYSSPENHFFFFSPGGLVLCGGLFGYIFSKNPASLRTSLFFGGPLLALSTLSLKVWGKGESSLPFILGQAGIASLQ